MASRKDLEGRVMSAKSVENDRAVLIQRWRLPPVRPLQTARDLDALPDDPAALKLLLLEAVCRDKRVVNKGLGALEPGRHYVGDGTGLFVDVSATGKVSCGQRLRIAGGGRRVELGLGSWPAVRPEEAQAKALVHQRTARQGKNPLEVCAGVPTVAEAVEAFFEEFGPTWVGRNTEQAYRASLARYVLPALGDRRVDKVRRADLAAAVKPAWVAYRRVGRDVLRVLRGTFRWVRECLIACVSGSLGVSR